MDDGKDKKSRIHALSGALLIAVDGAFFGANAVSFGLATPLICFIAFVFTELVCSSCKSSWLKRILVQHLPRDLHWVFWREYQLL